MDGGVVIDTGPLVAFLNRRDEWHQWAVDRLSEIAPPMQTCESVLAEATFLLRKSPGGAQAVLEMVERDLVQLAFELDAELDHVRRLMKKYADQPMSLADACLVRMSETHPRARILTLDRDFKRYRRLGRQVIPLIAPS